jgi:signal-transduction protein with cAMP-binding, CBS, and nucleotidyltransferase domain
LHSTEILSIVKKLKITNYLPGDCIACQGDYGQEMYFITKGNCKVIVDKGKATEKTMILEQGSSFGDVSLISNIKTTAAVYADTFCVIHVLTKKDYEELIEENKPMKAKVNLNAKKMDRIRKKEVIRKLRLHPKFKKFEKYELSILCEYVEHHFVHFNEILLKAGETTNNFMIIFSGKVNVFKNDKKTKAILKKYNCIDFTNDDEPKNDAVDLQCVDKVIYELLFELEDNMDFEDVVVKELEFGDFIGSISGPKVFDQYFISSERCELLVLENFRIERLKMQNYPIWLKLNEVVEDRKAVLLSTIEEVPERAVNNVEIDLMGLRG